jgi:hypothetical protein
MNDGIPRRSVVTALALASASVVLAPRRSALAAGGLPKLSVNDPAAVAVGYVEDAALVDPKKFPAYVKGSNCENCLQLQGTAGDAYRPCTLFKGKVVAAAGWCSAWTAEM